MILLAGLLATIAMALFVLSFKQMGLLSQDPVQAIGSSITDSIRKAKAIGLLFHLSIGICMAYIYFAILQIAKFNTGILPILGCIGISAANGYVVSFWVVISIGEFSHWKKFREEGVGMAVIYLCAHLLYGATLGGLFYWFRVFG